MNSCINLHPLREWKQLVADMEDKELLRNISDAPNWYKHLQQHRWYLRRLKQEAHRRGLRYE